MLFDAAGTLIELREPVGETYARVARAHGVALSPDQLEATFRMADRRLTNDGDLDQLHRVLDALIAEY